MTDFHVKVTRYTRFDDGSEVWDGCFYSTVYAIDTERDLFLVYDNGLTSSYYDGKPNGFTWVDFTKSMPDIHNREVKHPTVELVTKVIGQDCTGRTRVGYMEGETAE